MRTCSVAYFLANATEWEAVEMETVDADSLFQQVLGDYAYALESKGMGVETDFAQVSAKINVNTELPQRALDNLYSNLLKYAARQIQCGYPINAKSKAFYYQYPTESERRRQRKKVPVSA